MPSRWRQLVLAYLALAIIGGAAALWLYDQVDTARGGETLSWHDPWALALLGACLLLVWVGFHLRVRRAPTFAYTRVAELSLARPGAVARLASLPTALRVVAVAALAVGLARPRTFKTVEREVEGIDIVLVLDLSKSMEERDLHHNRLDAGQRTIRNFLQRREHDRVGLVVFAQAAMMQCPLTLDHRALDQIVADLAIGDVPEMGTAIGDALALALASLRRSRAQSRIVILLSDGDSNTITKFAPEEAKDLAVTMGVKVFTILLGQEGGTRRSPFGSGRYAVNPELLEAIARDTGGLYFRAGDDERLEESFRQVRDTLEKSRHRVIGKVPDRELFDRFALAALALLLVEIALAMTRWRRFP